MIQGSSYTNSDRLNTSKDNLESTDSSNRVAEEKRLREASLSERKLVERALLVERESRRNNELQILTLQKELQNERGKR